MNNTEIEFYAVRINELVKKIDELERNFETAKLGLQKIADTVSRKMGHDVPMTTTELVCLYSATDTIKKLGGKNE